MERLGLMIVVVMCATALSMPPTPLQKTIDGLFKTDARPHALEDLDVDIDDSDDEQFGLDDLQYDDDIQQDSMFADDADELSSRPSSRRFNDDTFSSRQHSLWPNTRALDDDDDLEYHNAGLGDDDDGFERRTERKAISRVQDDVDRIRSRLPTMHLSDEQGAIDNMAAIVKDAEELGSDTISPTRREKLKKATQLRMSSLRSQLKASEEESPVTNFHSSEAPLHKVNRDISQLEEKLETLHLPASTLSEAMGNLKKIQMNAKELSNPMTSRIRKEHLKEATNLRMEALRKEMNTRKAPPPLAGDFKVANVDRDIGDLVDKVNGMDMSEELREETLGNLAAITKDAHRISQTHGASRKRLEDAMKLRTNALKAELKLPGSSANARRSPVATSTSSRSDSLVSKVDDDLADVLQKMGTVNMPSALARETRENIAAIKRDTHKIVKTHGEEHKKLEEAIKLRTRALKQELDIEKSSASPSKASKIAKVDRDIAALEEKVADVHAPKALKAELKSNLAAIKKDSHMLASADGAKRERMMKAIGLRTKALKGEIKALSAEE